MKRVFLLMLCLIMVFAMACAVSATEIGNVGLYRGDSVTYHDTVEEALALANGGTVVLLRDVTAGQVVIPKNVTLNLNGCTLTADAVIVFNGKVTDQKNTGKIVVDRDMLGIMGGNGGKLPVWNPEGNCYTFASANYQQMVRVAADRASAQYIFIPNFDRATLDLLSNGGVDNGISVKVLLSWNGGASQQIYTFSEELIARVYSSANAQGVCSQVFMLTVSGIAGIEDMTACTVIESSIGGRSSNVVSQINLKEAVADSNCECDTDSVDADANGICDICNKHIHSYQAAVTAPTCTQKGYTTYTCSCGYSYVADEIAALGHTEVVASRLEPICTEEGMTEGKHCSVCNEVLVTQEIVPATGHSHTAVVTAPTCTQEGYTTYTCHCGDSYVKDYVASLGHTEVTDTAVEPNCTETGLTEGKHCSVCNEILTAQVVIPATGHGYDTVVTAPTCTEKGYTTYTCHCGDTYVANTVAARGHTEVIDTAVAPTCTETGLTQGKHCSVCNVVLVSQEEVPVLAHRKYVKTTTQSTVTVYTKSNSTTYPFSVSGNQITSTNKANSSSATYTITAKRAFTLELQYKVSSEANYDKLTIKHNSTTKVSTSGTSATTFTALSISMAAGDTVTITYAKDGSVNSGDDCAYVKIITSATQTVQTETTKLVDITESNAESFASCKEDVLCDVCGNVAIEKLDHTEVIDAAVAPTCGATGVTEGTHCSKCGEVLVAQESIPATGEHTYKYTVNSSDTTNIILAFSCTACGDSYTKTVTPTNFTVTAANRAMIGYTGESGEDLVIPAIFEDNEAWYRVVSIGDSAFYNCVNLTSVIIPDSVTIIEGDSFEDCSKLESVTIPNSVTSFGSDAFRNCRSLTSVTIPDGIKKIDVGVFENCSSLTSISIPDSVTSIGWYAFGGCTSLTDLKLSKSISSMESSAFSGCTALEEVRIPSGMSTVGSYAFQNCRSLKFVYIPSSVTMVGYGAFYGCGRDLAICFEGGSSAPSGWDTNWNYSYDNNNYLSFTHTLLNGLNNTGKTASGFYWFEYGGGEMEIIAYSGNAAKVIIPETINGKPVKYIRENAFHSNTAMVSVTLPSTLSYIGENAFQNCDNLLEVINKSALTITAGTTTNGRVAYNAKIVHDGESVVYELEGYVFFDDGNNIYLMKYMGTETELVLPLTCNEKAYRIYQYAFENNTDIQSVIISNGVTSIGAYAFNGCSNMTSITIGNAVTSIGNSAFEDCKSLTSVAIPDSVTSIGMRAFQNCTRLTCASLSNAVTSIGSSTFYGCSGLTGIDIPNNVTSIGSSAFYGCSGLTSIDIPNNVTSIGSSAFSGCTGLTSIDIPDCVTRIESSAFGNCPKIESITVSNGNTKYYSVENCLIEKNTNVLVLGCKNSVIPNGVTSIGSYAFYGCSGLTSITIPDGVTSIGKSAFEKCRSLTSIAIPDSVNNIDASAFAYCDGLVNISLSNNITSISSDTFYYCSNLKSITIPSGVTSIGGAAFQYCSSLRSVTLPDTLMTIGSSAFELCTSLTDITLPDSMTSIGYAAFRDCIGLVSINIPVNMSKIDSYAFDGCYKLVEVINKSSLYISVSSNNGYVAYYAKTVHKGTTKIVNQDGYLFYTHNNINYLLGYTGTDAALTLPNSYNGQSYKIYSYAFDGCSEVISITIPENVTGIGRWAFHDCKSLTTIVFEDTSTWYCVWNDSTYGGTSVSVNDASTNATYFKSTYVNEYWYKK